MAILCPILADGLQEGSIKSLIKSNLEIYFYSINHGVAHKDALMQVLKSRYHFEPKKAQDVSLQWDMMRTNKERFPLINSQPVNDVAKEELRDLIHLMFHVEMHLDKSDIYTRADALKKLFDKYDELYDMMKNEKPKE